MAVKPQTVRFISKAPIRIGAFPKLFTKDQLNDAYVCHFMIPKTDKATLTALGEALKEARAEGARAVWGKEVPDAPTTLYDGSASKPEGGEWPEDYKDHMILKASSQFAPQVFDEKKQPVKADSPEAEKIHSGVWGYPIIDLKPTDYKGTRIKSYLMGFVYAKDGESIGDGGANVSDALAAIPDVTGGSAAPSDLNALLGV